MRLFQECSRKKTAEKETREQRSEQNDFDAFGEEKAERKCKTNVSLAWYANQLFTTGTALVHEASVSSQTGATLVNRADIEAQFFWNLLSCAAACWDRRILQ